MTLQSNEFADIKKEKETLEEFQSVYDASPQPAPETKFERFKRHFNPGVIAGVGFSLVAMRNMIMASRRNDAHAFQQGLSLLG
jgi:hypothetical protein